MLVGKDDVNDAGALRAFVKGLAAMLDVVFIGGCFALLGLCLLYVRGCSRLGR